MANSYSWRSFLLSAALGVALFAVANVAVFRYSTYFQRERLYWKEVDGYFARPAAAILFAGDSHVAQLDNPLLAADAYNVAWGGDSFREVYAKLRCLIWRGARVKTLFLTTDLHMFGDGRIQSSNQAFVDPYLLMTRSPYGYERGLLSAALGTIPLLNDDFAQFLRKYLAHTWRRDGPGVTRGELGGWGHLTDAQRAALARDTGDSDHKGVGAHREPFEWYERIVGLARSHGIEVIPILYPAYPGYADSVPPAQVAAVDAELASLKLRRALDYRRAFSDWTYFQDPDHLSPRGAIALLQLIEVSTGMKLVNGRFTALSTVNPAGRSEFPGDNVH